MRVKTAIAATGVLALLAGCSNPDAEANEPPFKTALGVCNLPELPVANLGDDGATFTLDGVGADGSGLSHERMTCLLDALEVPDSVTAQMGATRALDGIQTATWADISASWTYHPDDGLDVILTFNRADPTP